MTDRRFLELLQNWLAGHFRRRDEAELRQLAEGDDFRREAWEGFQSQLESDHARHLAAARERIRAKHLGGAARIVQLPQRRRWLAAAAVLLLALVAVVFLPKIFEEKSASVGIAQQLPTPAADVPSASLPTTSAENAAPETRRQPQVSDLTKEKRSPAASPKIAETAAAKPAPPPAPATDSPSADMVLNEAKSAPDQAQSRQETAPTATFYKAKKSEALPPAGQAVDKTQTRTSAPDHANATPQAFGGLDEFLAFANQYARLPKEARDNNISGFVRLRFSVSDEGKAYNFQIIKSLGYGCDEEAVRLAQDFLWEASRGQMVSVSIPFVR